MLSSITDGAVLSDPVQWTARPVGLAGGDAIERVEFSIDGRLRWTERKAPYFFNEDHNRLYPWLLGRGSHRLAVRAVTVSGKTASTSSEITAHADQIPTVLVGTFTRQVSGRDVRRTQPFRNEPPNLILPQGIWLLHVASDGVIFFDDPKGSGGDEAFTALPDSTLIMQGPANWLEPTARQSNFCGVEPTGVYHWSAVDRTIVLKARHDSCADRNSLFAGVWKRA